MRVLIAPGGKETHAFPAPGDYTVTVTDSINGLATTHDLKIEGPPATPPTFSLTRTGDYSLTMDVLTCDTPEATITWDYEPFPTSRVPAPTAGVIGNFPPGGTTHSITVTDDNGLVSAPQTFEALAPLGAHFGPHLGMNQGLLWPVALGQYCTIDWGDGSPLQTITFATELEGEYTAGHGYPPVDGTYTATITFPTLGRSESVATGLIYGPPKVDFAPWTDNHHHRIWLHPPLPGSAYEIYWGDMTGEETPTWQSGDGFEVGSWLAFHVYDVNRFPAGTPLDVTVSDRTLGQQTHLAVVL